MASTIGGSSQISTASNNIIYASPAEAEKILGDVLLDLAKNGISKDAINAAEILAFDFTNTDLQGLTDGFLENIKSLAAEQTARESRKGELRELKPAARAKDGEGFVAFYSGLTGAERAAVNAEAVRNLDLLKH